MSTRNVTVSHDHEEDMLGVLRAFREGYFMPIDDDGEVIVFLIYEMTTLRQTNLVRFELNPEAPADEVAKVTVKEATTRLEILERRVRQLARNGRVGEAVKVGLEWLIPTPFEVTPGKRDPVGIAGVLTLGEHSHPLCSGDSEHWPGAAHLASRPKESSFELAATGQVTPELASLVE
ncbi:MAG: hypothetical protein OXP10_01340 [Chloroflexota bacterium]|nr:hypothetical protein [Chloroflexota bacterium]MDE2940978.1 hypothetical protein [Chloroflexota bacterium]